MTFIAAIGMHRLAACAGSRVRIDGTPPPGPQDGICRKRPRRALGRDGRLWRPGLSLIFRIRFRIRTVASAAPCSGGAARWRSCWRWPRRGRSSRLATGVRPTALGAVAVEQARLLLRAFEEAEDRIGGAMAERSGCARPALASPPGNAPTAAAGAPPAFCRGAGPACPPGPTCGLRTLRATENVGNPVRPGGQGVRRRENPVESGICVRFRAVNTGHSGPRSMHDNGSYRASNLYFILSAGDPQLAPLLSQTAQRRNPFPCCVGDFPLTASRNPQCERLSRPEGNPARPAESMHDNCLGQLSPRRRSWPSRGGGRRPIGPNHTTSSIYWRF